MTYPNVWEYLNDQIRIPIKNALSQGNKKEVMEYVDFLLLRYIELNAFAKGGEDFSREKGADVTLVPISQYVPKYVSKYMPKLPIDWDNLPAYQSKKTEEA